jgi:hypothetical protein
MMGYYVLVWGWYAIVGFHPAWFANMTWLIAIVLSFRAKYKWALYFSIATALLAIDGFIFPSKWFIGFYLWNFAMFSLPLINYFTRLKLTQVNPNVYS